LVSTLPETGVSSSVVIESLTPTGASLTGVTLIVSVAVDVSAPSWRCRCDRDGAVVVQHRREGVRAVGIDDQCTDACDVRGRAGGEAAGDASDVN